MVKNQEEIYQWFRDKYNTALSHPRFRRFAERHSNLILFVKERLSPRGYMGLHLTIGFAASAVFVWIFACLTEDILTGDPFIRADHWVLDHVLYFRTPAVTHFMTITTYLGGALVIGIGSLFLGAYLLFVKEKLNYAVTYVVAIGGGSVLVSILKAAIRRARPTPQVPVITVGGWSFPSAHSMMSVIFYGMIVYFTMRKVYSWRLRALATTAAGFLIFLIGLSRIYLQVHYLSDVLAGFAGGLFWLTVCITGLEIYTKKTAAQDHEHLAK